MAVLWTILRALRDLLGLGSKEPAEPSRTLTQRVTGPGGILPPSLLPGKFRSLTGHGQPNYLGRALSVSEDGWLEGPDVGVIPSCRHSPLTTPNQEPIGVVWHYTATAYGTAERLARRIENYTPGIDRAASWHLVISHKGEIYQSVPFGRGAWHCARGVLNGHRINRCTVGIELEGYGKSFTAEQIDAAGSVIFALRRRYEMTKENMALEHSRYDPTRRQDPGPVWRLTLSAILDNKFQGILELKHPDPSADR